MSKTIEDHVIDILERISMIEDMQHHDGGLNSEQVKTETIKAVSEVLEEYRQLAPIGKWVIAIERLPFDIAMVNWRRVDNKKPLTIEEVEYFIENDMADIPCWLDESAEPLHPTDVKENKPGANVPEGRTYSYSFEHPGIAPLWVQVKTLEQAAGKADHVLADISNTLMFNFGPSPREGLPSLIDGSESALGMLLAVLEYYVKRVVELEANPPEITTQL